MSEETNRVVAFVGRCAKCKAPLRVDLPEARRESYRGMRKIRLYNLDNTGWHEGPSTRIGRG